MTVEVFLFILIFPAVLFTQKQQLVERFYPLRLKAPSIHQLSICLQPVEHIMLLNAVLARIPMIRLYKVFDLIETHQPTFILRHITSLNFSAIRINSPGS